MRWVIPLTVALLGGCSLLEPSGRPVSTSLEEAARILELIETGALPQARNALLRFEEVGGKHRQGISLFLEEWYRRRAAARAAGPAPFPPGPAHDLRPDGIPLAPDEVIRDIKRDGLRLYSEGKIREAMAYWRHALQLDPSDREARALLRRANLVLENTGSDRTPAGDPAPGGDSLLPDSPAAPRSSE